VNQIQSVGLNRNNTNAAYNTMAHRGGDGQRAAPTRPARTRRRCRIAMPIECDGSEAMPGGVFAGLGTTSFSTNPHNLETYDYYNNPASPGYPGRRGDHARLYFRDALHRSSRRRRARGARSDAGQCRLPRAARRRLALGHGLLVLHHQFQQASLTSTSRSAIS
jgi:hypothetical protein